MGILLLVQPGLGKAWAEVSQGMRSARLWEGLGVPGSERSPPLGSPQPRECSLCCLPAARALQVIKTEIRIQVLHKHTQNSITKINSKIDAAGRSSGAAAVLSSTGAAAGGKISLWRDIPVWQGRGGGSTLSNSFLCRAGCWDMENSLLGCPFPR